MKSYKKTVRVDKDLKSAFKYLSAFKYQDGHKGLVDFSPLFESCSQSQPCVFRQDSAGSNLGAPGKRPQGRTNSSLR